MHNVITDEKIDHYLHLCERALSTMRIAAPDRSFNKRLADSFLEMATSYYNDARHFKDTGDYVNAYGCANYAYGWIDAGARIGLFDVDGDDQHYTLFE